jgi:hypothetical protein
VWKRFHIVKRNKTTTVEKDMKTLCHVVRDSERWISESFWAKVDDTMALSTCENLLKALPKIGPVTLVALLFTIL